MMMIQRTMNQTAARQQRMSRTWTVTTAAGAAACHITAQRKTFQRHHSAWRQQHTSCYLRDTQRQWVRNL